MKAKPIKANFQRAKGIMDRHPFFEPPGKTFIPTGLLTISTPSRAKAMRTMCRPGVILMPNSSCSMIGMSSNSSPGANGHTELSTMMGLGQ